MIKIKSKADRVVMWVLITIGLLYIFAISVGLGYGFTQGLLGR